MSIDYPSEVPTAWLSHLEQAGIEPTFRAITRRTDGISVGTVVRALTGVGTPGARVREHISTAIGISVDDFNRTRAIVLNEDSYAPFRIPTKADQLTERERELVLDLINVLLQAREIGAQQAVPASAPEPDRKD